MKADGRTVSLKLKLAHPTRINSHNLDTIQTLIKECAGPYIAMGMDKNSIIFRQ